MVACSGGGTVGPAPQGEQPSSSVETAAARTTVVRPYVDASIRPSPLADMVATTGVADAVFGFVLADGDRCAPAWSGVQPVSSPHVVDAAAVLRAGGGSVTVASGGADGPYLENACPDAESLAGAYATALDAVGATALAVDVEQEIPVDTVVAALRTLQEQRGSEIVLTLQVDDARRGLTPEAVTLVRAAADEGVVVQVDAMIMNFPFSGSWSAAMTGAVDTVLGQLRELWRVPDDEVAARTGATFMLGRTDVGTITTVDDAAAVVAAARDRGLGSVGYWAVGRDNGGCPDSTSVDFDCSGIAQEPFAFTSAARDAAAPSR